MKKIYLLIFTLWTGTCAYSQVDLKTLESSTPPSSVILGNSPTTIDRPSTPQSLATSLQNSFSSSGQLNPNLNIEIIPSYYMNKKNYNIPMYIRESYYKTKFYKDNILPKNFGPVGNDAKCHWWEQFKRSWAFSLSTSVTDTMKYGSYKAGLGIAGGMRVTVLQITPKAYYKKTIKPLTDEMDKVLQISAQAVYIETHIIGELADKPAKSSKELRQNIDIYITGSNLLTEGIKKEWLAKIELLYEDTLSTFQKSLDQYFNGFKKYDTISAKVILLDSLAKSPSGLRVDINTAMYGVVPGDFKNSGPGSAAIWFIPSYRFYANKLGTDKKHVMSVDIIGIVKYTFNLRRNSSYFIDSVDYFDVGGKLAFSYGKFSISGEAVYRKVEKQASPFINVTDALLNKNTWKASLTASYKLTSYLALQMTFGRSFDGKAVHFDSTSSGSLYYNAGFNFGLTSLSNNVDKNPKK